MRAIGVRIQLIHWYIRALKIRIRGGREGSLSLIPDFSTVPRDRTMTTLRKRTRRDLE